MFFSAVGERTELRVLERKESGELFAVVEANRAYLRRWHPWVDVMRSALEAEKAIVFWQHLHANQQGGFFGIWHEGKLCGMINYQNVDRGNRWAALSYWLDAGHQGRGIITASCRALIRHAFEAWNFNRITIECATENARSRAIPERLGFQLEGIVRQIEWLHDHYVDHAMYGLLRSDLSSCHQGRFNGRIRADDYGTKTAVH